MDGKFSVKYCLSVQTSMLILLASSVDWITTKQQKGEAYLTDQEDTTLWIAMWIYETGDAKLLKIQSESAELSYEKTTTEQRKSEKVRSGHDRTSQAYLFQAAQ